MPRPPRIVAILATHNERRFIATCLQHLRRQGVETYLIDHCSTDGTVEIAEDFLDDGLIGMETLPREDGVFSLRSQLRRKEEVSARIDADWLLHLDADELRLPPPGYPTLAEALAMVDREGYNAVNFYEFTFVPCLEDPDHDHPGFTRTLRTYYPFSPAFPHHVKAWKAAAASSPDLASSGGHRVAFAGLRMYPIPFPMMHYLFLSVPHAIEKYARRRFDREEVDSGWHGWRALLSQGDVKLPAMTELRVCRSIGELDPSAPRRRHCLDEAMAQRPQRGHLS